jgi:hypothetical protein
MSTQIFVVMTSGRSSSCIRYDGHELLGTISDVNEVCSESLRWIASEIVSNQLPETDTHVVGFHVIGHPISYRLSFKFMSSVIRGHLIGHLSSCHLSSQLISFVMRFHVICLRVHIIRHVISCHHSCPFIFLSSNWLSSVVRVHVISHSIACHLVSPSRSFLDEIPVRFDWT